MSVPRLPVAASAGTEAASFLNIPVGPAAAAMGSAYTALATDAYAPVWNPAGLAAVSRHEVAAQHLSYLESIHYEYIGGAFPMGTSGKTVGFGAQYLGTGDIDETNTAGARTGTYSSHFAAYSLAYGQKLAEKLSAGMSGKVVEAKISDVNAHAFAADAGLLYRLSSKLRLGAAVTNIGSKLKFLSESGSLPLAGKVSAAFQPLGTVWVAAEGVYRQNGLGSGHVGVEWSPIPVVALRAGYRSDTTKELGAAAGVGAGLGLRLSGHEFSYSWLPYGDLGAAQYFAFTFRFGREDESRRNLIQYRHIQRHVMAVPEGLSPFSNATEHATEEELMELFSESEPSAARAHDPQALR